MPRQLPPNASLVNLKKQAKSLCKAGNGELCLREAQHQLAQDYGFRSWKELRDAVLNKANNSSTAFLHIHCGDSSADALRDTPVPGQIMVWREIYVEGPVPDGITPDEFRQTRARHLSTYGIDYDQLLLTTNERYDRLASAAADFEEVILWFDACMFDQTIMIHIIDCLPDTANASLICVSDRGLGEYSIDEMAALLPTRQPLTPGQKRIAHNAWDAFTSDDPRDIEVFLQADSAALAHVAPALRRHLQEYPSTHNGLSRMQQQALQVIDAGANRLGPIFAQASAFEEQAYLGDTSLWAILEAMATCRIPLLKIDGPHSIVQPIDQPLKEIRRWEVSTTETGKEVLAGVADHVALNGIDRWLGGVHLAGAEAQWRWDEDAGRLVGR